MAQMIMVYFHNGCKAQFDLDKTFFFDAANNDLWREINECYECDTSIINLNNVSFIQPVKEEKDEL